jgi:hypothetical protein
VKIWFVSDLHFENSSEQPVFVKPDDADILVIAGDVHYAEKAADWLRKQQNSVGLPVVFVAGNHEFYRRETTEPGDPIPTIFEAIEWLRNEFRDDDEIYFLENDAVILGDNVRIAGATMWTDFLLEGEACRKINIEYAADFMFDYRKIYFGGRRGLCPDDTIAMHSGTRRFFSELLDDPHDGATVFVTHHAPHPKCCKIDDPNAFLNAAYACDMSDLMLRGDGPDAWFHGHFHRSVDFEIGNCRVMSNPKGRPRHHSARCPYDNTDWDSMKTIDTNLLPRFRPAGPSP